MHPIFRRANRFLEVPIDLAPRLLLIASAVLLVAIYVFPLWTMTMFAPQYPDGLRMQIYSYKLEGGNGGQDLKEINILNHYIGMRDLAASDFDEFKWMPFVVGGLGLMFLRAAVHGTMAQLIDVVVLYGYFAAFSLWSFAFKLYSYGHSLAAEAPVKVPPFMPPLFGYKQLANFEVYSYPAAGSYALIVAFACLGLALVSAWRESRRIVRTSPLHVGAL